MAEMVCIKGPLLVRSGYYILCFQILYVRKAEVSLLKILV